MNFQDASTQIQAWLSALVPSLTTTAPVVAAETGAFASVVSEVYAYLTATANNAFLQTATGQALIAKANDLGISVFQGSPATATLTVTLLGAQPVGWQIDPTFTFLTAGDALTPPILFVPTGITTVAPTDTTKSVVVQATAVGTATNVAIGAINALQGGSPYILTVTNAGAATGGKNATSAAQILTACQAALAPPGSTAQMGKTALAATNTTYAITDAVAIDTQDGAGTVNLYALDVNNTLTGATTTPQAVGSLSGDALILYNDVIAVAPPGITLQVAKFTVTSQNITVNQITQVSGSGLTSGTVTTAIQTYMNAFEPGVTFYPSQLSQYLFGVAFPNELVDVELSSYAPVTANSTHIVRCGSVTIVAGP